MFRITKSPSWALSADPESDGSRSRPSSPNSLDIKMWRLRSWEEKAAEAIRKANEEDHNQNYEDAILLYQTAIEFYLLATKLEIYTDDQRDDVRDKYMKYLDRIEELEVNVQDMAAYERKVKAEKETGAEAEFHEEIQEGVAQKCIIELATDVTEAPEEKFKRLLTKGAVVLKSWNLEWSHIIGLYQAKNVLNSAIVFRIKFSDIFDESPAQLQRVLLYGPSGAGKSLLAKVASSTANAKLISVSIQSLVSNWGGNADDIMKLLYSAAETHKPAIIHLDKLEFLSYEYDPGQRLMKTILRHINSPPVGVAIIGEANAPWEIDSKLLQVFEKRVHVPLPSENVRIEMMRYFLGHKANTLDEEHYELVGQKSEGYSGSEMMGLASIVKASIPVSAEEAIDFSEFESTLDTCQSSRHEHERAHEQQEKMDAFIRDYGQEQL